MHSFDQYGPILEKMIQDSNLAAALEGLQVMHTFVKLALDIKNVTFASHNYLLEKAPTHKANFKEICTKILLAMLERGEGSYLYPELIKRMKSNQPKIVCFTSHVINEAFKAEVEVGGFSIIYTNPDWIPAKSIQLIWKHISKMETISIKLWIPI